MPHHRPQPVVRRLPWIVALALLPILATLAPDQTVPARVSAQSPAPLIAYRMTDQWPEREAASAGLFQAPVDLDLSLIHI